MTKRNKVIYRIATLWLSLGMIATGIVQLLKMKEETDKIAQLGYPLYFLTLPGTCKMPGVITVLIPKFPLLKEWAYAGFFFAMSGAVFSYIASGGNAKDFFGPRIIAYPNGGIVVFQACG